MATTEQIPERRRRPTRRRRLPKWPPKGKHPIGYALAGVVLGAYSWILGGFAPFSVKSLIGVLIPGAVVAIIAYGWPPQRIPPPEKLHIAGVSYWTIVVAALFEWEASSWKDGSPGWHPSLTELINPLLEPHAIKSGAVFLWLLTGWGLVRR
jgi:hypothetical protein